MLHYALTNPHPCRPPAGYFTIDLLSSPLSQLDAKLGHKLLPDLLMQSVRFLSGQSLLETAVGYAVAKTLLSGLGVSERVDERDVFDAVARSVADNFHKIVLVEGWALRGSRLRDLAASW
jgi:hypothetical protein